MAGMETNTRVLPFGGRLLFRQEILFWLTAAVLLFVFLWSSSFLENESQWAEMAREMVLSGNWFRPMCNWIFRDEYQPGGLWCMVPFTALPGNTEFTARFPAALGALAVFFSLRGLGRCFFNPGVACMSCWILLGCGGFLLAGRSSCPDMLYTAAVTAAAAWFFRRVDGRGSYCSWLLFFFFCFAGALLRGPGAAVIPLLLVLPALFRWKRWRFLTDLRGWGAFLTAFAIYFLILFLPALRQSMTGGVPEPAAVCDALEKVWKSALFSLQSSFLPWDFWEALGTSLRKLLPWTLLLPVGWIGLARNWGNLQENFKSALMGVGITSVVLLFSGFCHHCALLPVFPLLVLAGTAGLTLYGVEKWNSKAFVIGYYFCLGAASLALCSIVAYPLWNKVADYTPPAVLVLAPVIAGAVSWAALFMDHGSQSFLARLLGLPRCAGAVVFSGTILSGCVLSVLLPVIQEEFRTEKEFFRALHRKTLKALPGRSSPGVIAFRQRVPGGYLLYNDLKAPVRKVNDLREIFREHAGKKVVVLFRNRAKESFLGQCREYGLPDGTPFLTQKISRWSSPNTRNNYYVTYLLTLPDAKEENMMGKKK